MPVSKPLPRHLRAAREKIYGAARGSPLDRNAKSRIMAYADGYNAMHRQKGQHWGPLTRACLQVLEASPDLGAPDQGLRLVGGEASHTATGVFAGPGEPSDCQLSLSGL